MWWQVESKSVKLDKCNTGAKNCWQRLMFMQITHFHGCGRVCELSEDHIHPLFKKHLAAAVSDVETLWVWSCYHVHELENAGLDSSCCSSITADYSLNVIWGKCNCSFRCFCREQPEQHIWTFVCLCRADFYCNGILFLWDYCKKDVAVNRIYSCVRDSFITVLLSFTLVSFPLLKCHIQGLWYF